MQQVTRVQAIMAAVGVVFLLSGGCTSPGQEAQASARDFLSAAQDGDTDRAARTLTTQARPHVGTSIGWVRDEKQSNRHGFTVGDSVISGDLARVPVTFTDENSSSDADLHLRREDGQWRVCGLELKSGVGPTLDVNFERPEDTLGSAFKTAGQALGMFARGMEQGAKEFERGFDQGYKGGAKSGGEKPTGKSEVIIEEATPAPTPTPAPEMTL